MKKNGTAHHLIELMLDAVSIREMKRMPKEFADEIKAIALVTGIDVGNIWVRRGCVLTLVLALALVLSYDNTDDDDAVATLYLFWLGRCLMVSLLVVVVLSTFSSFLWACIVLFFFVP